jgi:hypothetical protein
MRAFGKARYLAKHMREKHSTRAAHVCGRALPDGGAPCTDTFPTRTALSAHRRCRVHADAARLKELTCSVCPRGTPFMHAKALNTHVRRCARREGHTGAHAALLLQACVDDDDEEARVDEDEDERGGAAAVPAAFGGGDDGGDDGDDGDGAGASAGGMAGVAGSALAAAAAA